VLTKRAGLRLGNQDILVNAAGGIKVEEPGADLSIALSIASSFYNSGVKPGLAAVAEIGLNGELRSVPQIERRIAETARLNFKYILAPRNAVKSLPPQQGIEILGVSTIKEAIFKGLLPSQRRSRNEPEPEEQPVFDDEETG
jgi:DNA repair protein RadA/Sms